MALQNQLKLCLALALVAVSCEHNNGRWGMQDAFIGEIPAQIALLPCVSLVNPSAPATSKECRQIDSFVEKSFLPQSMLRALSNRLVQKVSLENSIDISQKTVASYFKWPKREFKNSASFLERYSFRTGKNQDWLLTLRKLRLKTRFSDAVFLPLLLENEGSKVAPSSTNNGPNLEQKTSWTGILIDPLTGKITWAKKAVATVRGQDSAAAHQKALVAQLFREGFWTEFPGWVR